MPVSPPYWYCVSRAPGCVTAALCDRCLAAEIAIKRPMARAIGQVWAERICRGELRRREAWPTDDPRTLAIARRKVAALATEPRLIEPLALACSQGAAAWWARRPARYRMT